MLKSILILSLALSSVAHAQSILDTLRDRVTDNMNQDQQSTTITYDHSTQRPGDCEKNAVRIAEERAKAACQDQYKKNCQVVDQGGITNSEQEVRITMQPIEKMAGFDTDNERECEGKALQRAREAAKSACTMSYGVEAACEVDEGRVRTPVKKKFKVPGVRQKKYECGASAIAFPRQNGSGSMFTCSATATAKVKKGGLRDIIRL